jgi:hypothetical protein
MYGGKYQTVSTKPMSSSQKKHTQNCLQIWKGHVAGRAGASTRL